MLVGGYTLDMYCDHQAHGDGGKVFFFADGPNCYAQVRASARKAGWVIRRDGTAVCPACSGKAVRTPDRPDLPTVSVFDLLRDMKPTDHE
jgi:hypothetical protein